jgi:hypothetical protein
MSMFELSKWKGSQSALRRVALLSLLGAASSVIGACITPTHPPLPELRAGISSRDPRCALREWPQDVNLDKDSPDELCIFRGGQLTITSTSGVTALCFRKISPVADDNKNPFSGHSGSKISVSTNAQTFTVGSDETYDGTYEFRPAPKVGECWLSNDHFIIGMTGTLEVGTGGSGEPPGKH